MLLERSSMDKLFKDSFINKGFDENQMELDTSLIGIIFFFLYSHLSSYN